MKYQKGGSFEQYYKTVPAYKNDTSNYDLRAYFNSNPQGAMMFARDMDAHAPDSFKLPNHPTFSDESIYFNNDNRDSAGHWYGNTYVPFNAKYRNKVVEKQMGGMSKTGYKSTSPDKNRPFNVIPSGRITMKDVPHPVYGIDDTGHRKIMLPGNEYRFPGNAVTEFPVKGNWDENTGYNINMPGNTFAQYDTRAWDGERVFQAGVNIPFKQQGGMAKNISRRGNITQTYPALPEEFAGGEVIQNPMHPYSGLPRDLAQKLYQRDMMAPPPYPQQVSDTMNPMADKDNWINNNNNKNKTAMKKNGGAAGHAGMYWNGERWVSSADGATYSNGVFYARGGKYSRDGGATFPIAGAGAMFRNGGSTASFYVDGNGYPTPFAMAPGSGQGSGYLQDLATHMQMGGVPGAQLVNPFAMNPGSGMGGGMLEDYAAQTMKRGGKPKKMSPAQMQMMQQMAQNRQMPMNMGAPSAPPMGMPGMAPQGQQPGQMMRGGQPCLECGGGVMADGGRVIPSQFYYDPGGMYEMGGEVNTEEMKSGGHWIQGAVNPKHKGYCTPMTKSTCTPRRKAFAMTMKKHHGFHKEYGGDVTQAGNLVRDNELYAMGGQFHPLARFMQEGGINIPAANDGTQKSWASTPSNYDPSADPNNAVNNPPPMPQQGGYAATQGPAYDATGATDSPDNGQGQQQDGSQQNTTKIRNGYGWGIAGAGLATLGAGLGIASVLSDRRDQRNLRNKNFNDRMTTNAVAASNAPGSMGDYDQYGSFRPNQNTPTRSGMYYPKMGQYGGNMYAMGGAYHQGQETEMDDAEIARLRKLGYKIEML